RRGTARWVATAGVAFTLLSARPALATTTATAIPATNQPPAATAPATPAGWLPTLTPDHTNPTSAPPPPTPVDSDSPALVTSAELVPTAPSYTVQVGDTLWAITDTAYPDATDPQLPRLVDTVFTTNRDATDPAGRRLTDPDVINPGMVLALPTLTSDQPAPPAPQDQPTPAPADVPPPGSPAPAVPASPAAGPTNQPPTRTDAPSPTAPATPSTDPASNPTRSTTPTPGLAGPLSSAPTPLASSNPTAPTPAPTHDPAVGHGEHSGLDPWRLVAGIGTSGLLAAAILGAVTQRRRHRDRQTTIDTAPPRPDPDTAALHTALLATATSDPTSRLDHALRALATLHTDTDTAGPVPQVMLTLPDGTLDVFLRDPLPTPPAPWEADAHGQVWTLPPGATLPPVDAGNPPPCPALVGLGTQPDGAAVHADLEALGTLTLDPAGHSPDALTGLTRALLTTLTLSPLAATPTIRTLGLDPAGLASEDRVHPATSLADLRAATTSEITHLRNDLTTVTSATTTFAARAVIPLENWEPTVVLVATEPTDDLDHDLLTDLAALAGPGSTGLALVQPSAPGHTSTWRLTLLDPTSTDQSPSAGDDPDNDEHHDVDHEHDVDGDRAGDRPAQAANGAGAALSRWRLDPLGLTLTPPTLAAAELDAVCALLADVAQPPVPAPPPAASTADTDDRPPSTATSTVDPPPAANGTAPTGPTSGQPPQTSADEGATALAPTPGTPASNGLTAESSNGQTQVSPPPYAEPDWQVMIHLYGPPNATNRAGEHPTGELARERTLEVLAWLATHRDRTRTNLETALWQQRRPLPRSVNNQLGLARRVLIHLTGDPDRAWIPSGQTVLRLHPAVVTDLDLLTHRLHYAQTHRAHPNAVIPVLTDALDLLAGTPALYPWVDAEFGSELTTTAIRAALLLSELHLDNGDHQAVLAATTRGLAIQPAHPGLFALRLRAHHAAGDPTAVTADYRAYLRAEQADDPDADTDPDLAHLHHTLTRNTRRPRPTATSSRDADDLDPW
ncbi:hypothetical protein I6A84_27430, partial [Frankia sp. CNm7]|uniref:hypothetical protein n=1 Tax=Frankia nepalensis TaxID=1836974 RepID=UPI0019311CA5